MSMKTIKVAEATNTQLDWLVAIANGWHDVKITAFADPRYPEECFFRPSKVVDGVEVCGSGLRWSPTTNPAQMWPIIEQERIATTPFTVSVGPDAGTKEWFANTERNSCYSDGSTSLIAAARCYVTSKLGETVEVPEELT